MSIDRASSATREEDIPATADGDGTDRNAERTARVRSDAEESRNRPRAEPRTREEYAEAARAGGGPMSRDSNQDSRDTPDEGPRHQPERPAERDRAEPRDRETYASEVRADRSADDQAATRHHADEPAARTDADTAAPDQHADSARDPQTPGDITWEHSERGDHPYQGFSVVEAERTVGDITPTGIGLKPTGEQLLLEMEGDDPSRGRLDRFFDKAFDEADDVSDAMGHIGEAIDADLHGPGPSGHPQSYHATTAAIHDQPPSPGPGVSDVVGSIAVTGVAAVVAIRHVLSELRKEHRP